MRYVVGLSEAPSALDALALAERLARRSGALLDIVYVLPKSSTIMVPLDAAYHRDAVEAAERRLNEAETTVDSAIERKLRVVHSDSITAALLEAAEPDATAIIVGALRSGVGTVFQGSVTNALFHAASLPVAVTPTGTQVALRSQPISRVSCLMGTRPGAANLINVAIRSARRAGIPLRIVSLVEVDQAAGELSTAAVAHAQEVIEQLAAHARAELPGHDITTETGTGTTIEDAVSNTSWDPGEIAMVGSSRLAAPRRLFLGSVATKVARVLPVPLVVVPSTSPDEEDTPPNG